MTRGETQGINQVMSAFANGEMVEVRRKDCPPDGQWEDAPSPAWNWWDFDYRVKPAQPQSPREFWIALDRGSGLLCGVYREHPKIIRSDIELVHTLEV